MDTASGFDHDAIGGSVTDAAAGAVNDAMFDVGGDERRMHVRAYNHWVSLLKGRPYPPIDELDPANIVDFGPNSVLLDFTAGVENPGIAFLGRALREECGLDADIKRIADVPSRSLLSRLTDHYLQIIANRAPIGFEAEFVGTRGRTTLYRGILMPFSSDGADIDFIYGVINWKELVDAALQASLAAELVAAVEAAPAPNDAVVWADGPSAGGAPEKPAASPAPPALSPPPAVDAIEDADDEAPSPAPPDTLAGQLSLARESAAQVRASDARSRAALYRALGRAHDFALAADRDAPAYDALLAEAGIVGQARAPMTPVVKLVFGADHDKTRLTEYAAVLAHARRHAVARGGLGEFLDAAEGGIKAIVLAERAERRPVARIDTVEAAVAALRQRPAIASVAIDPGDAEFVVLLARATADGSLDIVGRSTAKALVAAAIRAA